MAQPAQIKVRKGMPSVKLTREEFAKRFRARFYGPAFGELDNEIQKILARAWERYDEYRKTPRSAIRDRNRREASRINLKTFCQSAIGYVAVFYLRR